MMGVNAVSHIEDDRYLIQLRDINEESLINMIQKFVLTEGKAPLSLSGDVRCTEKLGGMAGCCYVDNGYVYRLIFQDIPIVLSFGTVGYLEVS